MPKNIVICCDGTGNGVEVNLSNVLKLYRSLKRGPEQVVYYDTGIGTLGKTSAWSRLKQKARGVFGMITGYGLDEDVTSAYRFLCEHYCEGDNVFLFGFSRGAYTVRVLAGFLRLVGLLHAEQSNLADHAFTAYKQAAQKNSFEIAWRFQRVTGAAEIPVKFLGVWDTVSSIIVPRRDRFYIPSLQLLPYTATNSNVAAFRHAVAIDERRRMFRINRWTEPQDYHPNRFDHDGAVHQDVKQVWFTGVHGDVGGGYSEAQSGLAKYPLAWMVEEAAEHGLKVKRQMVNHLALGHERSGGSRAYVAPDAKADAHKSLTFGWKLIEWLPKNIKWQSWPRRFRPFYGFYIPWAEPRFIEDDALIHASVVERLSVRDDYDPVNLPKNYRVEPWPEES